MFADIQHEYMLCRVSVFLIRFFISPRNSRFRIWITLPLHPASIYGFHMKTVRFPYRERTVSNSKPYGFDIENVKVCFLEKQYDLHAKPNGFFISFILR